MFQFSSEIGTDCKLVLKKNGQFTWLWHMSTATIHWPGQPQVLSLSVLLTNAGHGHGHAWEYFILNRSFFATFQHFQLSTFNFDISVRFSRSFEYDATLCIARLPRTILVDTRYFLHRCPETILVVAQVPAVFRCPRYIFRRCSWALHHTTTFNSYLPHTCLGLHSWPSFLLPSSSWVCRTLVVQAVARPPRQ